MQHRRRRRRFLLLLLASALIVLVGFQILWKKCCFDNNSSTAQSSSASTLIIVKGASPAAATETLEEQRSSTSHSDGNHNDRQIIVSSTTSKNRPRIAYITYAYIPKYKKNIDKAIERFARYIFPSLDTWLLPQQNYYVVLTLNAKNRYYKYLCPPNATTTQNHPYVKYCKRLVPIFVDCPEGYFGLSPCCKNEKGMLQMFERFGAGNQYDWFAYIDDDMYVRQDYLQKYIQASKIDPLHEEVLLVSGKNGEQSENSVLGLPSYKYANSPYRCSSSQNNEDYMYPWGQPVVYSRKALQTLQGGFQLGGLVKQCLEFDVSHDVGNAIFHWMYSIPHIRLPWPSSTQQMKPMSFGVHGVNRRSMNYMQQSSDPTSNQQHHLNYTQVHEYYTNTGNNNNGGIPVEDVEFSIRKQYVNGYQKTTTYQKWGDPRNWINNGDGDDQLWHTMPTTDCNGGGGGGGGVSQQPQQQNEIIYTVPIDYHWVINKKQQQQQQQQEEGSRRIPWS